MKISFVMVKPAYPSNVGATARALKTMGFSELLIVDPVADLTNPRVRALGKHADDIIDSIRVYPDLPSALEGIDIAVAATHRIRQLNHTAISSRDLNKYLADRSNWASHAAVVMGPESTGLSNSDVACCDALVQVPCAHDQPSLNLAQAVMILAYELSGLSLRRTKKQQKRHDKEASPDTYRNLKSQVATLLEKICIDDTSDTKERVVARLDALSSQDLSLVHRLRQAVERALLS